MMGLHPCMGIGVTEAVLQLIIEIFILVSERL